ncbi:MAG: hypothetical protein HY347_03895 [candidate division NC10 bacterium]|nr:hypothetical protein [candidate division NC10 bacterium]
MLTKRVQILFDPVEFERLQKIARREKKSVGALIREVVARSLFRKNRSRFEDLKAFGIWAKEKRTDQEILAELGGSWRNFPLHE